MHRTRRCSVCCLAQVIVCQTAHACVLHSRPCVCLHRRVATKGQRSTHMTPSRTFAAPARTTAQWRCQRVTARQTFVSVRTSVLLDGQTVNFDRWTDHDGRRTWAAVGAGIQYSIHIRMLLHLAPCPLSTSFSTPLAHILLLNPSVLTTGPPSPLPSSCASLLSPLAGQFPRLSSLPMLRCRTPTFDVQGAFDNRLLASAVNGKRYLHLWRVAPCRDCIR